MTATFTILIATYNAAPILPRTLDSLVEQTCQDFNVIIQDGASSDDTIAVAQSYVEKLPVLLLHSEVDTGIYDAWNKALGRWQDKLGEWILFLGAGDELVNNEILSNVVSLLQQAPQEILFTGGSVLRECASDQETLVSAYEPELFADFGLMLPHSAMFHRKDVFSSGRFDTKYKIMGDNDFLCKYWNLSNGNFIIPFIVTKMLRGGISDNPKMIGRLRYEAFLIKKLYTSITLNEIVKELIIVLKGYFVTLIYVVFKRQAPTLLNFVRVIRGKRPCWKNDEM